MKKRLILAGFFTAVLLGSAGISYGAFSQGEPLRERLTDIDRHEISQSLSEAAHEYGRKVRFVGDLASATVRLNWTNLKDWVESVPDRVRAQIEAQLASAESPAVSVTTPIIQNPPRTLSEMQALQDQAAQAATFEPSADATSASSPSMPPQPATRWAPDQDTLSVEAVLVPRRVTVISSSQDGRIADIPFGQGDRFKKGDTLIAYDCADLEAEAEIAGMEKTLTSKKTEGSDKLFKLDIISDVDRLGIQIEDKQAASKVKLYQARMDQCFIKAEFDGRVTNRLANPGEYTRTDRVLMEVASDEPLQAEFMVPSKWLRWLNTGAPLTVTINETEASYRARISRIYGEVDPVSQSIQIIALLDGYTDNLLPGMSGQAKLSISEIEKAGVRGFLQISAGP